MKRILRDNGLTLAFGTLFLLALVGQSIAGLADVNNRLVAEGGEPISYLRFVSSSEFVVDVAENWQSEYLQFFLFILATVWFVQRGSTQSKPAGRIGRETDKQQHVGRYATARSPSWARVGGLRGALYARSLGLLMGGVFLLSWFAQSVAGQVAYNAEQLQQHADPLSWPAYVASAEFWNRTLQNWQSEFLAVASITALSIYLRERGSPESKPVGAPHDATGVEG
jgi:hypothetical protein